MFISGMNRISQNPALFITCCFNPVSKSMFRFPFAEPSAVRITRTAFLCFYSFWNQSLFNRGVPATGRRRSLVMIIFVFLRLFPCAFLSSLISFCNSSSYQSASCFAIRFLIFFYCLHKLLREWYLQISQKYLLNDVSYILLKYVKKSVQTHPYPETGVCSSF